MEPKVSVVRTQETSIKLVEEKIKGMRQMVESTIINDDQSLAESADKIKNVKDLGKAIRAEMEKYTKPAQQIINEARTRFLPYEKECKDAEAKIKAKAGEYMTKKEEERIKKEESIARRAENGQLKEETAVRKMEELGDEKKSVTTGMGTQIQHKTVKEVVIVDPDKVPKEYWIIDEVKVRKVALAGVEIPGVEVRERKQIAVR